MTIEDNKSRPLSFTETTERGEAESIVPEAQRYTECMALEAGDDNLVERLIAYLDDPSWRVRKAAVSAVGGKLEQNRDLISALIESLSSDRNARLRNTAAEVLIAIGASAVDLLIVALGRADSSRRKFLVEILGFIGTDRARASLFAALNDRDRNVQAAVVEALGRIGGEEVVDELTHRVGDVGDDPQLLSYLFGALAACEARLSFDLLDQWATDRVLARLVCPLLGLSGDPRALDRLFNALVTGSRSVRAGAIVGLWHTRETMPDDLNAALDKWNQTESEFVDRVRESMHDKDARISSAAFQIVLDLRRPDLAPDILHAAAGESWESDAVMGIVGLGTGVVQPLLERFASLRTTPRVLVLEVLELLGDESVVAFLVKAAHGGDSRAAEAAVSALGRLGGRSEVDALVELMLHGESDLRAPAAQALIAIGKREPERVADQLRQMLDDFPDRPSLYSVLGQLRRSKDLDLMIGGIRDANPKIRRAAIDACLAFGGSFPEEVLLEALNDAVGNVRAVAARALGAFGTDQAMGALRHALSDDDPWVVSEVVEALGRSGAHYAVDSLLEAALHTSPVVVISGLQALARLCPVGVDDVIDRGLAHPDTEVVQEAIKAMRCLSKLETGARLIKCLEHSAWDVRLAAAESALRRRVHVPNEKLLELIDGEVEILVRTVLEQIVAMAED